MQIQEPDRTAEIYVEALRCDAAGPTAERRDVGVSRAWNEVLQQVARAAPAQTTVLVTGESGTGKEVVANLLHRSSSRAHRPFVAIDCAALPEHLLESQLFGHERGAFTGATSAQIGRIEQAAGGTLFLDQVAEMSPRVQAKFLRLLEEREFQRLGGTRTLRADVRVIAATNRDLEARIAQHLFRPDLYYRLDVFRIHIPPLRSRREDILVLADAFLGELGRWMGRGAVQLARDAQEWLCQHSWPGNVRELRNALERAMLLCDGGPITREHLPLTRESTSPEREGEISQRAAAGFHPEGTSFETIERRLVEKALAEALGNKLTAARLLGLTRAQFYALLGRYRLD
jgi:two-component system NtrC family response regulator